MTPKERAAMQQALDALEKDLNLTEEERIATITALREVLASCLLTTTEQAEQEPVAKVLEGGYEVLVFDRLPEETLLYAAPVRTKDLTDDEIRDAFYSCGFGAIVVDGCRAVIAADREKNK